MTWWCIINQSLVYKAAWWLWTFSLEGMQTLWSKCPVAHVLTTAGLGAAGILNNGDVHAHEWQQAEGVRPQFYWKVMMGLSWSGGFVKAKGSERGHLKVHKSPSESFAIVDLKQNSPLRHWGFCISIKGNVKSLDVEMFEEPIKTIFVFCIVLPLSPSVRPSPAAFPE